MMSSPLKVLIAVSTKRSPKSASVTLPTQATASPPNSLIVRTTSAAGSSSRSLTTMRAPSRASLSASARPMPRPEPEIRATLPASLVIFFSLSVDLDDGFAVDRRRAGVGDGAHREARAAPLAIVEYFGDLSGRGHGGIERRDRGEAHGPAQQPFLRSPMGDRKGVVSGRSVSVRVNVGGRQLIKKKKNKTKKTNK